jgi:hypothetical protein
MAAPQVRRGSQSAGADYGIAEEEEYYVTRPHTSVRRYRQPAQRDTLDDYAPEQTAFIQHRRASSMAPAGNGIASKAVDPVTPPPRSLRSGRRSRVPWLAIIVGMVLTLGLFFGFSAFGSWWQLHQNDVTYGRPRTFQIDAVVGHQDSASKPSHFIFENLNGHVVIIEFPGGDPAHATIYTGPTLFGDGGDLVPVTGEFKDVNGDGRLDMIVHLQDQTIVFINNGTRFRPLQPGEHVSL